MPKRPFRAHRRAAPLKLVCLRGVHDEGAAFRVHERAAPLKIMSGEVSRQGRILRIPQRAAPLKLVEQLRPVEDVTHSAPPLRLH